MGIRKVSLLISGFNNTPQNEQINPPVPGMPKVAVQTSAGEAAGTDFGAAGTYQPGQQTPTP